MKNYHTHTYRCKHATGDIADYAKAALANDITVLGFTDHTPLPDNRWLGIRMHSDELKDYVMSIRKARLQFPGLSILCGMECDYLKEYHNFYREELMGKWGLDYLIAGVHFFSNYGSWGNVNGGITNKYELKSYARAVISAMESGLFTFISHPDMFANSYREWDEEARAVSRDMLAVASCCGVVLEINSYGLRKEKVITRRGVRFMYPLPEFWELAKEYKIKVVVNSDAHSPQEIGDGIKECMMFANKLDLSLADFSQIKTC